jgi:hypothetical protein
LTSSTLGTMLDTMSDDSETSASPEDVKAKFREALERKNKQSHESRGTGGPDSPQGTEDTHAHGAKREFRRKSG